MKSIIYNLFKNGYESVAASIVSGWLLSFLLPIQNFLIFTVAVVFADMITGIKAARKEGQKISSKGLYRTTEKIVVYFVSIMIFELARKTFSLPFGVTYSVASMIAFTELFSVAENVKRITGVNLKTLFLRFFRR